MVNNSGAADVETGSHGSSKGSNLSKLSEHSMQNESAGGSSSGGASSGGVQQLLGVDEVITGSTYLKRVRGIILICLFILAAVSAAFSYVLKSRDEEHDFELQAHTFALEISDGVQDTTDKIFEAFDIMSSTISSHAKTTTDEWPFETFPSFERIAFNTRSMTSGATSFIATAPTVEEFNREEWEGYAYENKGWVEETITYQRQDSGFLEELDSSSNNDPYEITKKIYEYTETGQATTSKVGPYLPLWQVSSNTSSDDITTTTLVNFNLLSNAVFKDAFQLVKDHKEPVLTKIYDGEEAATQEDQSFWELQQQTTNGNQTTVAANHPASVVVYPIYDDPKSDKPTIVGVLMGVVEWDLFLSTVLHQGVSGMVCVLTNTCGQTFTYKLNDGSTAAELMGVGDLHDRKYDDIGSWVHVDTPFASSDTCQYNVQIYPSVELEEKYKTYKPPLFTGIWLVAFALVFVGFMSYDTAVQKRQREAMKSAARSDAIVSSLFPAEIRDRLFNDDGDEGGKKGGDVDNKKDTQTLSNMADPQKLRLKHYLTEEEGPNKETEPNKEANGKIVDADNKPIADLFPNTTVMFADIAGFTAWSSVREPSQVFTLLETVYKAFDNNAKRRRVFKVETVGDCYVAVTGLPEANKEHAITMCRFARECVTQFQDLVSRLEVTLGPDTGDLGIRVGLHSGPVTAGVLRGEKSRFQLFGDTVNTAARIETTGQRNRIHLSHETAEKLHEAGKSNWITKRNQTVTAKGKGEMQTYWLLSDDQMAASSTGDAGKASALLPVVKAMQPRLASTGINVLDPESNLPPRIKRLVDWNVDVLKRLLKQIVARRNALNNKKYDISDPAMMKVEVDIGCDTFVLNEVTEIIKLPKFEAQAHKQQENPNKIELPKEVEDQLRLYVSSIAAMHRNNPFHNFEHASHVMMSVSKLLARIVAPDEILNNSEDTGVMASELHDHTYGITSDPLTQFSVVLAALIHDVDHSGVSNFQLIKENAKIATVFKNKSVAEQNSIVLAWERLMESRFAKLRGYIYTDPEDLKRFRQLMVNTVLATDIFDKELQSLRKNRWEKAFHSDGSQDSTHEEDVNRKATIVIEHLIQASDVAHTMQHWHIYQKWNERLFEEMMVAYENGRMGKNPSIGWYQGELGFFDNYVIPLAKKLKDCGVFGVSSDEYLNYALENRREWSIKGGEAVDRMLAKLKAKKEEEAAKKEEEAAKAGAK